MNQSKFTGEELNDRRFMAGAWNAGITRQDLLATANHFGIPPAFVAHWVWAMDGLGWRFSSGVKLDWRNWRRSLRAWWKKHDEVVLQEQSKAQRKAELSIRERSRKEREARLKAREQSGGLPYEDAKVRAARELEARRLAQAVEGLTANDWALCAENCRECDGSRCTAGFKLPCDHKLKPRPVHPRECPRFAPREG